MNVIKSYLSRIRRQLNLTTEDAIHRNWLKISKSLHQFRDIHKGESCFILGNGPSLNSINLDRLIGIPTLASNKIYLIYDKTSWRPTYHFASDHLVIEQSIKTFFTQDSTFFLSYLDTKNRVYPINFNYLWIAGEVFFNGEDITQKVCGSRTVTYIAMQVAYYMGFKNVYLVGVDHYYPYYLGKDGEIEKMDDKDDLNHFHPDYFKNNYWTAPDLAACEIAYRLAKYYFEKDGRSIFNSTVGGKLDIFERIDFDTAVERAKENNSQLNLK